MRGHQTSLVWKRTEGSKIPRDAIPVSDQKTQYIARLYHEGTHPGKTIQNGASISYAGKEIIRNEFEILCGSVDELKWVDVHGACKYLKDAVLAGYDGEPSSELFIARSLYLDAYQCGKTGIHFGNLGMHFSHDGQEMSSHTYQVLCFK